MADRPEIPRDLVRDMENTLRRAKTFINSAETNNKMITKDILATIAKLDALEQPPDPAEVAATQWYTHSTQLQEMLALHIRKHYAEREKAVRALVEWLKPQGLLPETRQFMDAVIVLYPEWDK